MSARAFAVVVVIACALGACASTPPADGDAPGATLELVNRTSTDLAVSVRGRVEAMLRPGTRMRVRELGPGPALLVARAMPGGPGAFEVRHEVALARGQATVWTIMPDAAGGPPLDEPPALGALVVRNTLPGHVVLTLDGAALGRVFAGATRTFLDLPAGSHALVARPEDGSAPQRATLDVPPGGDAAWVVAATGGVLVVDNRTDETIALTIDGAARGLVRAGEVWQGTIPVGTHVVSALGEPSRRPYERTLTIAPDGAPDAGTVTWRVEAGQAALVVANRTGEPLAVRLAGDSAPAREVAPGASLTFDAVPTGRVGIEATGLVTKLTWAGRVDLAPGQEATWVAEPIAGSVRVVNRTARPLWIYTRTAAKGAEREAGVLAPDQAALLRELPRKTLWLAAVDPVGKRRYETTLDLSELPADTWTVLAETGSLVVTNERDEPVAIYVDAAATGEVPAHGERTFPGLAVGRRLVEAVGQRTGYVQRDEGTIREDHAAAVTLPDPSAFVIVDNTTGEPLDTRGALAEQVGSIAPGTAQRFRVRAGLVRVAVSGRESGLLYQTDLEARRGAEARWVVRLDPASLTVWNQLPESVAVTVDDRAYGSVGPDKTITIADLPPGRRSVQAVGLRSGSVRSETVDLTPGAAERLTLTFELGALLVENRASEPVAVSVDGRPYGEVGALAVHAFGKIAPGRHVVTFDYTKSRRVAATALEVRAGQRAKVVAEVPLAPVVITNGARQDVRVTVDGELVATVGNDAPPALVHVPAGPRLVLIERLADRSLISYRLDFWADTALHLPVPPRSVRLVVVNRQAEATEIRVAEHVIGRVEAGASALFEDLPDGAARLFATAPDGRVTHTETRRIEAGETATWVLDASPSPRD